MQQFPCRIFPCSRLRLPDQFCPAKIVSLSADPRFLGILQ
ncbi:unnamed protein product [Haemonchus placei]|uniref:Uncharacterized protein n=1 Tax=Haemonchus placei TaxID=6290 RepID=A0A3P7YBT6_HAEPC|nr:unnamed protein product [Haemonchus placei]